jgi:hypothetical protein
MLEQGRDESIEALAAHFDLLPHSPTREAPVSAAWPQGSFRLFISHVSEKLDSIAMIKNRLSDYGISCFIAQLDIEPTREWQDEIEAAIRSADALAAVLTPNFRSSTWTDQEIGIAVGSGVLVIPIDAGLAPYGFLARSQALPVKGKKAKDVAELLVQVLTRNPATAARMGEVLVGRLEVSTSWNWTRALMTLIEQLPELSPELIKRIEAAEETNSEVGYAHSIPERIQALNQRFNNGK